MANEWPTVPIRVLESVGGEAGVGVPVLVKPRNFVLDASDFNPSIVGILDTAQGGIAAGALEDWHEVGATDEPGFANSWVNFDGGYATAAFRKLPTGLVVVKGLVKFGVIAQTIFILPVGYRPALQLLWGVDSGNVHGRFDIFANGLVVPTSGDNNWFPVNAVFMAEA